MQFTAMMNIPTNDKLRAPKKHGSLGAINPVQLCPPTAPLLCINTHILQGGALQDLTTDKTFLLKITMN